MEKVNGAELPPPKRYTYKFISFIVVKSNFPLEVEVQAE